VALEHRLGVRVHRAVDDQDELTSWSTTTEQLGELARAEYCIGGGPGVPQRVVASVDQLSLDTAEPVVARFTGPRPSLTAQRS
jgi:hypothetical protein